MIIRTTLSKLVMCSDLSFLLKMYYSKQRQGQFLSLPLLIFFAMMIKMGTLLWGDRIFEKCGIRRDEEGDGGKTLEIRGKRRLSARDGGANYQQS